jgi:uncharacterized sulfatase
MKNKIILFALMTTILGCNTNNSGHENKPPNILFIITDDQSWEHLGCYGDKAVRTPNIDTLAWQGVLFKNAYCAAPSCSPSRASILTGQDAYRLEEGGILTGFIRKKYNLFTKILSENGYIVGYDGKGYWPRTMNVPDAYNEPIGKRYNTKFDSMPPQGIGNTDHGADLAKFLDENVDNKPFFFWAGIGEPHVPHLTGLGLSMGIDTSKIRVPKFYPNTPEIKLAISEYLGEIEWADRKVGLIMKVLRDRGLDKNTVVVFTSDNGMPFPRGKTTLYNHGDRMPLIVKWPEKVASGIVVDDPVSLIDLAPTFLEIAGIDKDPLMTGKSIVPTLLSKRSGEVDSEKPYVVSSFELHCGDVRQGNLGFPRRSIHTIKWTYIVNYEPSRYPAGEKDIYLKNWGNYGDVDPSNLKSYFLENEDKKNFINYFEMSFGKVPREELYNKIDDPDMINNLARNEKYDSIIDYLSIQLNRYLKKTNDPRSKGLSPWDSYYYDKN